MFVRYISHEIRTPLNVVSFGLQLLKQELLDEEGNMISNQPKLDIIDDIYASCETATRIIDDLLDYDKFDRGAIEMDVTEFNVAEAVFGAAKPFVIQVYYMI